MPTAPPMNEPTTSISQRLNVLGWPVDNCCKAMPNPPKTVVSTDTRGRAALRGSLPLSSVMRRHTPLAVGCPRHSPPCARNRLPVAIDTDRIDTDRIDTARIDADRIDADRIDASRIDASRIDADRI